MKQALLLLFFLPLTLTVKAQSGYCLTFDEYEADTWHPLSQLELKYRSGNKSLWYGGATYKPTTGDSQTDNVLKKQARLIRHKGSLYLNCHGLSCVGRKFGNRYATAYVFDRDYFLFTALSIQSASDVKDTAKMFGLIGGAVAAYAHKDDFMCYILFPRSGIVEPIDQLMMDMLLEGHPDLLAALGEANEDIRFSPQTIIPLLRQVGLIELFMPPQ